MTLSDVEHDIEDIDTVQACLFTASYDGQLRVWKDIENQAIVAASRDLGRQQLYAIPNYSLEVIIKTSLITNPGTDQYTKQKKMFIFVGGSGYHVQMYQLPDSSYYQPIEPKKINLFPSCPHQMTLLGHSTQARSTNTADIKLTEKHIFAATDNGHIVMTPMSEVINLDETSHYNENQFSSARQMAKLPDFTGDEPRTFSESYLGCTAISLWRDYALFISDNKGRIHVWIPDYEREIDTKEPVMGVVQTVYNGNPALSPYRPMQSLAVDPFGNYLAATDWNGLDYIFRIHEKETQFELESISICNPAPIIQKEPYEKDYGLKCVWSSNGMNLAIAHSSGNVFIYETIDNTVMYSSKVLAGDISQWVWSVSWELNGNMLVTGNAGGLIQFWIRPEQKEEEVKQWREVGYKSIKLTEHLKQSRQLHHDSRNAPSPVISSLQYKLIPQSIFDRIKELKDSEDKRDKRTYDFDNYRRR